MTTTPGARAPSSASVYHKFTGRQGPFAMTFYLGSPGGKIANGPKLISPNARSCCGGSCGTDGGLDGIAANYGLPVNWLSNLCAPTEKKQRAAIARWVYSVGRWQLQREILTLGSARLTNPCAQQACSRLFTRRSGWS